ncbi:MAG: fumarylacetoacetate hydrolase family protein [Proteobacteria bacterium]|nr:fumarylacetoacetate hydrolase family protein [Pseudomonadota bacterium]
MVQWLRFHHNGESKFGKLTGETICVCQGDMFFEAEETGESRALSEIKLDIPCCPSKIVALWNNSRSAAEKQGLSQPEEPLFFIKASNTFLPSGGVIRKPAGYDGRVLYEAELGVVVGRQCVNVAEAEAADCIFGYTCVNDVTALQILNEDESFAQWTRAKGFDTFGPFGPVIVTGVDMSNSKIRAELNGRERQNYPVSDLFMGPAALVSRISKCMTLYPGDIISCGTGPGALPMKPGASIEIIIDGIGALSNTYDV